jgi:hypothetical protein
MISEINNELSLQRQMDKITQKSKIPVEEGESELMKMMDASRAIPIQVRIHLSIQIRLALSKTALYNTYDNSSKLQQIVEQLGLNPTKSISTVCWDLRYHSLLELYLSGASFFDCFKRQGGGSLLFELEQMIGEQDVLFYPGSYRRPYQIEDTDNANVLLRAEVLNRINSRKNRRLLLARKRCLKK